MDIFESTEKNAYADAMQELLKNPKISQELKDSYQKTLDEMNLPDKDDEFKLHYSLRELTALIATYEMDKLKKVFGFEKDQDINDFLEGAIEVNLPNGNETKMDEKILSFIVRRK